MTTHNCKRLCSRGGGNDSEENQWIVTCVITSDLPKTRSVIAVVIFCFALYRIYLHPTLFQEGTKAPSVYQLEDIIQMAN